MNGMIFKGVVPAIATPFKNGALDEEALRRHIDYQIKGGVQAILFCGTTGESPTLSHDEHKRVIAIGVEECRGKVPVMASAGSNCTAESLDFALHAKKVGADGLLVVTPYYNKPTQEGIFLHFKAIAEAAPLPIIAYNIPGRCGVNILPETLPRMVKELHLAGVKEATGDLNQMIRTIELCGPDFLVSSGDDGLTLPLLGVGGHGIISVAANLIPAPMVEMWQAWEAGQVVRARELFYKMLPLFKALFIETNPIPLKAALGLAGFMDNEMRLPMCQPQPETVEKLKPILKSWGLIR